MSQPDTFDLRAPLSLGAAAGASGWTTEALTELARMGLIERLERDGAWTVSVLETVVLRALRAVYELNGSRPPDRVCAHLAAGLRHALLTGDPRAVLLWPGGLSLSEGQELDELIHLHEVHLIVVPQQIFNYVTARLGRK